jgi:anti-sigma regulatory factor (Ser/Thr protein kinase)
MSTGDATAVATFGNTRGAAREARRWAEPLLHSWDLDGQAPDVLLVIAELVTNSVLHGNGGVTVRLDRTADTVRIEVTDQGEAGPLVARRPPPDATGGRGLLLVEHFTSAWGAVRDRSGTTVWAELPTRAQSAAGAACND